MSYALQNLKENAPENHLACLYLPEAVRDDVAALYAFAAEVNRIPHIVSEPMLGEIRLQWWRDLIKSGDNANSGPLAAQLMDVITRHNLPRETFHTYLNAKTFDLYQDPMPDMGTLEGYIGETKSALLQLQCLISGSKRSTALSNACGHAGMAIGLCDILSRQAYHRHTQRLFIPMEMIDKHGLSREAWLAQDAGEEHLSVIHDVKQLARMHLQKSRLAIADLPKELHKHFLSLAHIEPMIKSYDKLGNKLFSQPFVLSALRAQWHLLRAAFTGI